MGHIKLSLLLLNLLSNSKRNILYWDLQRDVYVGGEGVWKPVENWWSPEIDQWNYNCFPESIQKGPEWDLITKVSLLLSNSLFVKVTKFK